MGLYRDNGKENGEYYAGFRIRSLGMGTNEQIETSIMEDQTEKNMKSKPEARVEYWGELLIISDHMPQELNFEP